MVDAFTAQAKAHPDRLAIAVTAPGEALAADRATFAEVLERAGRFAGGLRAAGFGRGDRLLLAAPVCVDFYALAFAAAGSRMPLVLVDGTLDRRRLLSALRSARVKGVVGTAAGLRRWWMVPPLHGTRRYAIDGAAFGVRAVEDLRAADPAALERSRADETAIVSYTSGSTGRAKGVVRTNRILLGQHRAIDGAIPAAPDDVDMPCFPAIVLHNLCLGVSTVLPPVDLRRPADADPAAVVDVAERMEVTTLSGAPAYMERVVAYLLASGRELPKVRRITVGGAPVSRALCAAVLEAFPDADARVIYGATEAEPIAHVSMAEVLAADGDGVLVGTPVPQVKVIVADGLPERIEGKLDRAQLIQARARIGEVVVRGEGVARTYVGDPAANGAHKLMEPSGAVWHRTGDIARRDRDGRLWLLGRRGDAIQWRERTIHPLPLEAALRELPGVRRAGLVMHSRAPQGEVAVVGDEAAVVHVREHLRGAGLGELAVRSVDAIPMDRRHHSKIDRPALAALLARRPANSAA
ncbi:MAG TPA: AMP-binding protein [Solirubrobacteraceae bacterium]|nr:AMP-binding protein [Solirubrobacteraceae bacterium]